jgi:hypothetical protein
MREFLHHMWESIRAASPAPLVTIEIAIVGLIVSWWQLRYAKKRDRAIDARNSWTELHKLMTSFRFKRELLNQTELTYPKFGEAILVASESLHDLKGQIDRMADSPLVNQIAGFLIDHWQAEKWRSSDFQKQFDEYARQVAFLTRTPTQHWFGWIKKISLRRRNAIERRSKGG